MSLVACPSAGIVPDLRCASGWWRDAYTRGSAGSSQLRRRHLFRSGIDQVFRSQFEEVSFVL